MTRALSGVVQLTPDQALGIAQYFHLGEQETDYLMLLVEQERASSSNLKKRLQTKIIELAKANRNFASAVKTDSKVSDKDIARYYTSWIYPATHVACLMRPSSLEELCNILKIAPDGLLKALNELKRMGLIVNRSGRWEATNKNVHLAAEHPLAKVAHLIWRNHAIHKLQASDDEGLHYSAIHCLSVKDIERIRKKLKDLVLECREIIDPSPSEALAVFCLDWYTP
jgi:uncharacterized protein (TIGR02147 family)